MTKTPTVPIHLVWLNRESRQRSKIEVEDLKASIAKVGLIQPIILHTSFELLAGERRLVACKELGWTEIPAIFFEALSESDKQRVELEENAKRRDLPWQDYVKALAQLHKLYSESETNWIVAKTAAALATNETHVKVALQVAEGLRDETDSKLKLCSTMNEAYNVLKRRRGRVLDEELNTFAEFIQESFSEKRSQASAENCGPEREDNPASGLPVRASEAIPATAVPVSLPQRNLRAASEASILEEDFLIWAKEYSGPKFNLIHCDFPYGTNVFGGTSQFSGTGRQSQDYADTEDTYWKLLECLEQNLDRICAHSAHLVFWLSFKNYSETLKYFQTGPLSSFELGPNLLVWHKSCYSAIVGNYRLWPKHSYEVALFASRGERQLIESGFDSYAGPTDHSLHPSTKPEPMLRFLFKSFVDSNTRLLDPTCGSGAALRAAESLGAKYVLGLEKDSEFHSRAVTALHASRIKRAHES